MEEVKSEAQFSIYKVSQEKIEDFYANKNNEDLNIEKFFIQLKEDIKKEICKRKIDGVVDIEEGIFSGFLFKTKHTPEWKNLISSMMDQSINKVEDSDFISNSHISYILFCIVKESIYVFTGGLGSTYIKKYIEPNFGLYILPKLLTKTTAAVKHVNEGNLIGSRISTHKTNRINTSISVEQDMGSIYKEISVELSEELAKYFGIDFTKDYSKSKKLSLINKDSLVIRRSFDLKTLEEIILNINRLEYKEDNFILNYFVFARKLGIKTKDIKLQLIDELVNKKHDNFVIIGDDYEEYIINSDRFLITTLDEKIFLEKNAPIEFVDIFDVIENQNVKLTKTYIENFLYKCKLETFDKSGNPVINTELINTIQGFIEFKSTNPRFNNQPCYLISGYWYIFEPEFSEALNLEFNDFWNSIDENSRNIKDSFGISKIDGHEEDFNKHLETNQNVIVSHKVLLENIEIADVIFWDKNKLYLMHNKRYFDANGSRDVSNQISVASEFINTKRLKDFDVFIDEYYDAICKKRNIYKGKIDKTEFISSFKNKKICYIALYLENSGKESKSNYAKYLTVDINKKLSVKGMEFLIM